VSEKPIPNASPGVYATLFPALVEVARAHGYALALHGSMLRDMDMIAVPWVSDARAAKELADALRDCVCGFYKDTDPNGIALSKPHGRRCWSIHLGGGCYLDLSVMPRLKDRFRKRERDGKLVVRLSVFPEDALARPYDD
jgi:hypothetical protein